jgi:diguanylate cyclase (GGDEF)-like protein/putative nucleotidyltransferase with HDIG domain
MPTGNWKTLALWCFVVAASAILLAATLPALAGLDWRAALWCLALLALTAAASRYSVQHGSGADGGRAANSIASAFVFLAGMMFGPAPASVLAGVDGLFSSRRVTDRMQRAYLVAAAAATTSVAVHIYEALLSQQGGAAAGLGGYAPLGSVLVPLCVMALVQYSLNTLAAAGYVTLATRSRLSFSREGLIWTSLAQVAGGASAALLYSGLGQSETSYFLIGLLIIGLVYLLFRFDEARVSEVRRADEEKLRHVQEIADLHMNTIESLAVAIDAKDQTTHGHVRRTQIYAMELGKMLGVGEKELLALQAGALLHDVGKLAVPEYILNKPGKLTTAEFEKMKIHTVVGGDIIRRVNFPYPVEDIVRFHHEKWDGSGYPKGLRAEEIPLVARIIAVVDFFDATRCDRPYRLGMKREDSIGLLRKMAGSSFDPRVVEMFADNIDFFDNLIAQEDIREQVQSDTEMTDARPDAGLASDVLGSANDGDAGYRSIVEAQREVFALHEIAQTIGSSLNLQDTVTLVAGKLRSIVPFDTCAIYLVDERTGKAVAAHVAGEHAEVFQRRRVTVGEGITGWVIANARSMCNTPPELDLVGVPEEVSEKIKGVLVAPLIRENGAFGAITLYSQTRASYTTEHVRLLESVSQHASVALNNAVTYEKTKESALTDPLTELPNARAFHLALEQRIAECQRLNREPVSVMCMDLDDFKQINDSHGHGVGDRLLAAVGGVIKKQLRQMDILARYAGDEFVAIMPMASSDVAQMVAERVRGAVESQGYAVRTGRTARVGVSIGIACFPADGETAESLLDSAGRRMQQDKHTRKLAPKEFAGVSAAPLDAFF